MDANYVKWSHYIIKLISLAPAIILLSVDLQVSISSLCHELLTWELNENTSNPSLFHFLSSSHPLLLWPSALSSSSLFLSFPLLSSLCTPFVAHYCTPNPPQPCWVSRRHPLQVLVVEDRQKGTSCLTAEVSLSHTISDSCSLLHVICKHAELIRITHLDLITVYCAEAFIHSSWFQWCHTWR